MIARCLDSGITLPCVKAFLRQTLCEYAQIRETRKAVCAPSLFEVHICFQDDPADGCFQKIHITVHSLVCFPQFLLSPPR